MTRLTKKAKSLLTTIALTLALQGLGDSPVTIKVDNLIAKHHVTLVI